MDESVSGPKTTKYRGGIKAASADLGLLQPLAKKNLFNRFEGLFTPDLPSPDPELQSRAQSVVEDEQKYLKRRYNITSHLTGSMPLNLGIPNDVDIDFFVRAESPKKYKNLVRKLNNNPRYKPSPYNKPGTGFNVFQREAQGPGDFPVDLAIAYGKPAKEFKQTLSQKLEASKEISPDLRQGLIEKKNILKHTPFDFNNKQRYRDWKRHVDEALTGASVETLRLKRTKVDELQDKTATIVDLSNKEELNKFKRFADYKDTVGHRTHNIEGVLESGGVISALEALKRGKLKSFEAGRSVGTHKAVDYQGLSKSQLADISSKVLKESPDTSVFRDVAKETGRAPDEVKADFLRQEYGRVKKYVSGLGDPETFRRKHLSLPKLGPQIFVTKGGVIDTPEYGDSALLARSRKVEKSPYVNIISKEHVLGQRRAFEPRKLNIGSGYLIVPKKKIQALDEKHPDRKFVAVEDIPEDVKKHVYVKKHDFLEIPKRWIPQAFAGNIDLSRRR